MHQPDGGLLLIWWPSEIWIITDFIMYYCVYDIILLTQNHSILGYVLVTRDSEIQPC